MSAPKVRIFRDPEALPAIQTDTGAYQIHGFPWKAEGLGIKVSSVDQPGAFRMVERMLQLRTDRCTMTTVSEYADAAVEMRADWCNDGSEVCDVAQPCTGCELVICPDHCDEFTTCVVDVEKLHHLDCALGCPDCAEVQS